MDSKVLKNIDDALNRALTAEGLQIAPISEGLNQGNEHIYREFDRGGVPDGMEENTRVSAQLKLRN